MIFCSEAKMLKLGPIPIYPTIQVLWKIALKHENINTSLSHENQLSGTYVHCCATSKFLYNCVNAIDFLRTTAGHVWQ